jgi:hypothetical protein
MSTSASSSSSSAAAAAASSAGGGGGGGGERPANKTGTLKRFNPAVTFKQPTLKFEETTMMPTFLAGKKAPPPPPAAASVSIPPFQKKVDKRKEHPIDEKVAKSNGIHMDLSKLKSSMGTNQPNRPAKKARSSSSEEEGSDHKTNPDSVIDDEAEEDGAAAAEEEGGSDSFVKIDEEWNESDLQPSEWAELKELEKASASNRSFIEASLPKLEKLNSVIRSRRDGAKELNDDQAENLKTQCEHLKRRVKTAMDEMAKNSRRMAKIRTAHKRFVVDDDEDADDNDDDEVVISEHDADEAEEPLDSKVDADEDVKMTDAAEAKAAMAHNTARARNVSNKRQAHRKKRSNPEEESDNSVGGAGQPYALKDISQLIESAKPLRRRNWTSERRDEWDHAMIDMLECTDEVTKQLLTGSDFRYCYRYRTEQGAWQVTAHTITHMTKDSKGRPKPLVTWTEITVSAPSSKPLNSLIVFSGALESLYRLWENTSDFGIGALNGIASEAIRNQHARDACRLGLIVMLATFQLRNPNSC